MASKIDSESEEEHFGSFMKMNKPKLSLSNSALSNVSESASKLLSQYEKDYDEDVIAKRSKVVLNKKERILRSNKKQTSTKKTSKNRKLQFEQSDGTEEEAGNSEEPVRTANNKRKRKTFKDVKRKAPELLCVSDDDSSNSMHNYRLRPKSTRRIQEEVVTVSSSPAETISVIEEEEGAVAHSAILEIIKEEAEMDTDQCECCKLERRNCAKLLSKGEDQASLLDNLKALQEFNQNTEKYILQQHRNLLKHPEMDSLCNSIDNSKTNNFLTQEKREWIEKFMDSMMADRIDYVKPNQMNSVQGLQHSSVDTDTPVSETDHVMCDSITIVKRIDFEKEKKARLSQLLERQRSWLVKPKEPATPSFTTNAMGFTSTPITTSVLSSANKKSEEDNIDLSKLDYSFVTMRTPMKSNVNEEQKSSQMVLEDAIKEEIHVAPVNEGQNDSQILTPANTDDLPESNTQNSTSAYIPRHLRPPTAPMNEEQIMDFVDDLLGAEATVITQLIDENFDRIMKYNETNTTSTGNNVINLIDDIYSSAIDDSVILIDDNVNTEDDNSIQILDDSSSPIVIDDTFPLDVPSTSRRPKQNIGVRNKAISKTSKQNRNRIAPISLDKTHSEPSDKRFKRKHECPICLESMDTKEISSTTCGHIFCTPCIKQAIKQTKKCPNCRKGLNFRKIHPLYL